MEGEIEASGHSLRDRIRSWWYGVEIPQLYMEDGEDSPAVAQSARTALAPVIEEPPLDRLDLLQAVWGAGYLEPGGAEYIQTLVKPFGFNPAMSVLDLTVGLGGPARRIADGFNIYINGMERDPVVAERGRAAMLKAGMARRVLVSDYDPETFELRPHSFDGIYAMNLTASVAAKDRMFREVKKALKAGGHFTFTDFVLKGIGADDPALAPWLAAEPSPLKLWTAAQYAEALAKAGLDCRISESQGEIYSRYASEAWAEYFRSVSLTGMSHGNLKTVLTEASLSNHRTSLIGKGLIDVYRFYAIVY